MKHIWSVICEKSAIDFETNLLSMFNCIEEINTIIDKTKLVENEKLFIPVNFQIISFWLIENFNQDNSIEVKGELIDPQGKTLNEFRNTLRAKKGVKHLRNRTNIQGLPVTETGRYYFRISQKKDNKFVSVTELPLDVNLSYKLLSNQKIA